MILIYVNKKHKDWYHLIIPEFKDKEVKENYTMELVELCFYSPLIIIYKTFYFKLLQRKFKTYYKNKLRRKFLFVLTKNKILINYLMI